MHKMNEKIAQYFMKLLETEKRCDEVTAATVRYAILTLLDGSEKFLLLSLMYGFFYDVGRFYLAFAALISLRFYMGGSHRETWFGCLLSSVVNFGVILGLSDLFTVPVPAIGGLALLLALEIVLWVPLASPQQPRCTEQRRRKMQKKSFVALAVWACIIPFLPAELANVVFWAWAFQAAEVLLVALYRRGAVTVKMK